MNELIQQSDTLQAVKDTIATVTSNSAGAFKDLHFSMDNITKDSLILTVLGYSIVFLALLFLFLTFFNITKLLNYKLKRKLKESGKTIVETEDKVISGEVSAAISLALMIHFREVHDFESTVITMKKVQKPYSPWSSKIYGLRHYPEKR